MRKHIVALAALLVPLASQAGGYVVPNVNARDLSMGGSLVAAQQDAAATYANPASLSKLDGLNLSLGDALIDFRSTWTDSTLRYGGVSTTMTPKGVFPPALYAAYGNKLPNGMRYGVGAGATIPGGGYVFWPPNWPGKADIISVDRKVWGMYLTAGLQPLPQVRLGGGLVYYRTSEHLVQAVPLVPDAAAEIGTSGGAVSYDLSAEVTPLKDVPLAIAVDYKHQGVQHLSGHAHFDNIPATLRPSLLDQTATHTLTYPNQLNVGASYRVIKPLLVTAGMTWERFHVYQQDLFQGSLGTTVLVPRDYKNGYTFRLGAEYQVLPRLTLRAGVLRDISPSREATLSPTLPDSDSWAVSVGAGYEVVKDFVVNLGYFHDKMDKVTSTRPEFPGDFDTRANIVSVSGVYRFGI